MADDDRTLPTARDTRSDVDAFLRKVAARVDLRTPAHVGSATIASVSTGAALAPLVSITADPVEFLLWTFGRDEVEIDISGAQRGIDALEAVPRGI